MSKVDIIQLKQSEFKFRSGFSSVSHSIYFNRVKCSSFLPVDYTIGVIDLSHVTKRIFTYAYYFAFYNHLGKFIYESLIYVLKSVYVWYV